VATVQQGDHQQYNTSADNKRTTCPCVGLFTVSCFDLKSSPKIYKIYMEVIRTVPDHAMAEVLSHWLLTMEA